MTEQGIPDRRKHGYAELENRLDDHAQNIEDRLRRFFIKALIAFAVLGTTSAISLFGFGLALENQAKTSKAIQEGRILTLVKICEDQNRRHDAAIEKARTILPERSLPVVRLLIDELQFKDADCRGTAEQLTKGQPK